MKRAEAPTSERQNSATPQVYLRPDELAERWSVAGKTLANNRCKGLGPAFVKSNSAVRYALSYVLAYKAAGRVVAIG